MTRDSSPTYAAFGSEHGGDASKADFIARLSAALPAAVERRHEKKRRYMQTLRDYRAAGHDMQQFARQHPNLNVDDPDTAVLHCLSGEDGSAADLAPRIGIPPAVLQLYASIYERKFRSDLLHTRLSRDVPPGNATQFAIDWLTAVPVGADLGSMPARLVAMLLVSTDIGIGALARDPELLGFLSRLSTLHEQSAEGMAATSDEWRAVRHAVIDWTDRAGAEGRLVALDEHIATIAENAAADCRDSLLIYDEIVEPIASVRATAWLAEAGEDAAVIREADQAMRRLNELRAAIGERAPVEAEQREMASLTAVVNARHVARVSRDASEFDRIASAFIEFLDGPGRSA